MKKVIDAWGMSSLFSMQVLPGSKLRRAVTTCSDDFYWPVKTVLAGPRGFDVEMFFLPVWTKRGCR